MTPMVVSTTCDSLCENLENHVSPQQLGLWELIMWISIPMWIKQVALPG